MPRLPPANVVYTIDGISNQTTSNNSLILFDVEPLNYGNHQITVQYGGSSSEMPLTFCGYAVSSGQTSLTSGGSTSTISSSLPRPPLTETPTATSKPLIVHGTLTQTHSPEVALILGATVAGVALLFLFSFILQSHRQQRKRRLIKLHSDECGRA